MYGVHFEVLGVQVDDWLFGLQAISENGIHVYLFISIFKLSNITGKVNHLDLIGLLDFGGFTGLFSD